MKKCVLFLFSFSFLFLSFRAECSTKILEKRLELQEQCRPGSWCLVPWNNGWSCSEILAMEDGKVAVKLFDTALPVSNWPIKVFNQSMIRSFRCSMTTTLDDLINYLKRRQILRSDFIEEGFRAIDRSWFCEEHPYFDAAIDISCDMCISSPHMHVFSLEMVKKIFPHAKKILDLGTGTGYMAAICAYLAPEARVYGIDCFEKLVVEAENRCARVLPESIRERITFLKGKGEKGYEKEAPYDLIYVGYMCKKIPSNLVKQLKPGGILLIPIGSSISSYDKRLGGGNLVIVEKDKKGIVWSYKVCSCSFIPTQKTNPKACLEDQDKADGGCGGAP
ncbi:MAG: methyltransferase domain-containing protein [Candidatus Neptunochlamydia sp.]|nr:methyltransferase domain-containing protein [Candidatus Neptunochlamydia sp.]